MSTPAFAPPIERSAKGVVDPTPTLPLAAIVIVEVPTRPPLLAKYPTLPVAPANNVLVAIDVGTAEALPLFPRTPWEIAASPMVPDVVMVPPVRPLLVAIEVTVPLVIVVKHWFVPVIQTRAASTPPVKVVEAAFVNLFVPEKLLLSARSVDEAD